MRCIISIVKLNEEEVSKCREVTLKEGRDKSTQWTENEYRKGFLRTAATFMGVVGEFVVDKVYFQQGIDESVSSIGDGGRDIIRLDKKIDVKCQRSEALWAVEELKYYGGFYVVAVDKNNREKELKYDMVFFTTVDAVWANGQAYTDIDMINHWLSGEVVGDKALWEHITRIKIDTCGLIWKDDILKNKDERKAPTLRRSIGSGQNYYIKREELYLPESTKEFDEILTRGYTHV